jgi:hypothetical protein
LVEELYGTRSFSSIYVGSDFSLLCGFLFYFFLPGILHRLKCCWSSYMPHYAWEIDMPKNTTTIIQTRLYTTLLKVRNTPGGHFPKITIWHWWDQFLF